MPTSRLPVADGDDKPALRTAQAREAVVCITLAECARIGVSLNAARLRLREDLHTIRTLVRHNGASRVAAELEAILPGLEAASQLIMGIRGQVIRSLTCEACGCTNCACEVEA